MNNKFQGKFSLHKAADCNVIALLNYILINSDSM